MHKFHGQDRERGFSNLRDFDIILTTYATLAKDFSNEPSILFQLHWFRVVLDEGISPLCKGSLGALRADKRMAAHWIRNQSTKQFYAAKGIITNRRWCLTGTPIQNKLEDVGALVRFLRIPLFDSSAKFQRHIIDHCSRNTPGCDQNLRLLLGTICLRRTKRYLDVPEAIFKTVHLQLSTDELALYSKIIEMSRRAVDEAVSNKSSIKRVNGILVAIHRVRMLCDLGTYYQRIISTQPFGEIAGQHQLTPEPPFNDQALCDLCGSPFLSEPVGMGCSSVSSCSPLFCPSCLGESGPADSQPCERSIRKDIPTNPHEGRILRNNIAHFQEAGPQTPTSNASSPGPVSNSRSSDIGHSTKLSAVLNNIQQNLRDSKRCSMTPDVCFLC